ncbi:MAG: ATP synthase F0 subunit B [Deltaproteobacteria bacterium]|nr:ATP synthase F0 subunit B [Deltaproteobacteria bacterium]
MKRLWIIALIICVALSFCAFVTVASAASHNTEAAQVAGQDLDAQETVMEAEDVAGEHAAEHEGEHGGGYHKVIDFGWRLLSFIILAAILYKLTAKGIKGFFVGNREAVVVSLKEAEEMRAEAEKKLQEVNEKIEKASAEIENIAAMIKAQGVSEKEKIVEDAKKTAEKMKEDATTRIDQEFKKAVAQLRVEATELSVQMAEEILKKNVTKEDHDAMVKDFIDRMVTRN